MESPEDIQPDPPDNEENEQQEGLDLSALTIEDAPADIITPDHKASKQPRGLFALGGNTKKEKEKPPSRPRKGSLVEPLENLYTTIGAMITPFDPVCGNVLMVHAHHCAETLDNLAQHNEAVRRALLALTQTSVWGTVLAAHAPILLTISIHHIPAMQGRMGDLGEKMQEQMRVVQNDNDDESPDLP